jgi:hypothetical protein
MQSAFAPNKCPTKILIANVGVVARPEIPKVIENEDETQIITVAGEDIELRTARANFCRAMETEAQEIMAAIAHRAAEGRAEAEAAVSNS